MEKNIQRHDLSLYTANYKAMYRAVHFWKRKRRDTGAYTAETYACVSSRVSLEAIHRLIHGQDTQPCINPCIAVYCGK